MQRYALLVCVACALQVHAAQLRQLPQGQTSAAAMTTFQDMADTVLTAKSKVGELLDHMGVDNDRLRQDYQAEATRATELTIEKQSLQSQMGREKQKLTAELAQFKAKMVEKIATLQASNRQLEETNMKLVAQGDRCAAELEGEKAKKDSLVKKLQKMGSMFNHQQAMVRKIIEQQQQRVSDEVTSDVRDAVMTASDPAGLAVAAAAAPVVEPQSVVLDEPRDLVAETASQNPLLDAPAQVASQTSDIDAMLRDTIGEARAFAEAPLRVATPAQSHHVLQVVVPQEIVQPPVRVLAPMQTPVQKTLTPVQVAAQPAVHATAQASPRHAVQQTAAHAPVKAVAPPPAPTATTAPVSQGASPKSASLKVAASPAKPKAVATQPKMINKSGVQAGTKPQVKVQPEPSAAPLAPLKPTSALRRTAAKAAAPVETVEDAEDEEELVKAVGATVPGASAPPPTQDAPEDDDQLKMLRSEVAKLEQSVKTPEKNTGGDEDLDDLLSNV